MDESSFQKDIEEYKRISTLARKILGVDKNAGKEEIKKAYWKLAMKYHPDRFVNDGGAGVENRIRFENIQAAYDFLVKGKMWKPVREGWSKKNPEGETEGEKKQDKYKTDSKWGYFLWWRDRFF